MRFRPGAWLTAAVLLVLAVLIGLGSWQVQRLEWKEAVIAERATRRAAPPISVAAGLPDDPGLAFRRAVAEGRFLHESEMLVIHRTHRGRPGYEVVTPLRLADGGHVLVNRGWIPIARADPARRRHGRPAGRVALSGFLRPAGKTGRWLPDNDPVEDLWYYPDIVEMAARARLPRVAPLLLVAEGRARPGGLPIPLDGAAPLPNRHLEYALTWYGLAAALAAIYMLLAVQRGRPTDEPDR